MKCICEKEILKEAISTTSRLVSTRSTLPVLQAILITTGKNSLILRTTDLEQALEVEIQSEIQEGGAVAVPGKIITDFLQNNNDTTITLELEDTTLVISSANHKARIKSFPAEDYPTPPVFTEKTSFKLPANSLKNVIERCVFATSQDDTRPILTGVLFQLSKNKITAVATDGYRLAMHELPLSQEVESEYIFPRRALVELAKLTSAAEVTFIIGENQARLVTGSTVLTTRLLDGAFPNYKGILPKDQRVKLQLRSSALLQNLRLASIFSRDSAYSTKIELQKGKLVISAVSAQVGESSNELIVESTDEFSLSVNAQYLIDALQVINQDITLGVIDQKSPVVITIPDEPSYLYLVMPLRNE